MSHSFLLSINAAISVGNSPNMQKIFSRILLQLNQIPCIQSKYFKKKLATDLSSFKVILGHVSYFKVTWVTERSFDSYRGFLIEVNLGTCMFHWGFEGQPRSCGVIWGLFRAMYVLFGIWRSNCRLSSSSKVIWGQFKILSLRNRWITYHRRIVGAQKTSETSSSSSGFIFFL